MRYRASLGLALIVLLWLPPFCSSSFGSALGDIVYSHRGDTDHLAAAYFPHWVHRIKYKCYACHDELFAMTRGPNPTMASMAQGKSCGACHNGKYAFGVDMCQRCHIHQ